MEVTITDMAEDGSKHAQLVHFLFGDLNEVGETGEGYGNIGGPDVLALGSEGEHGPEGLFSCRPEGVLFGGGGGKGEGGRMVEFCEGLNGCDVLLYGCL